MQHIVCADAHPVHILYVAYNILGIKRVVYNNKDNLDQYRLSPGMGSNKGPDKRNTPPRRRIVGRFLKGPIPWNWLQAAGRLPGKALHVGLVLWLRSGIQKSTRVQLSQKILREMGIGRHSVYRGLKALEKAGLVEVERRSGRLPVVNILGDQSGAAKVGSESPESPATAVLGRMQSPNPTA